MYQSSGFSFLRFIKFLLKQSNLLDYVAMSGYFLNLIESWRDRSESTSMILLRVLKNCFQHAYRLSVYLDGVVHISLLDQRQAHIFYFGRFKDLPDREIGLQLSPLLLMSSFTCTFFTRAIVEKTHSYSTFSITFLLKLVI
jgi:hypothetical protein